MLGESKDPAIKLFGKTIPLSHVSNGVGIGKGREGGDPERDQEEFEDDDDDVSGNDEVRETSLDAKVSSYTKREDESWLVNSKEARISDTTAGVSSKTDEEQSTSNPREKVMKKPDKILPCPRCNSMQTKFCYYNNYNVNQPRHFCKNCQRYWTAGGTMRNVPVGAGRRKSKSSSPASNCRHITVPEALQIPNGFHHLPQLKTNGTIPAFGSTDSRLCESMASVLNIGEKSPRSCTQNGFCQPGELIIPVACRNGQNGADIVNGVQAGDSLPNHERENSVSKDCALQNLLEIPPQMPCFPGIPWLYPLPPPALVPQVIPMPLYPAAAYWSIPWISQLPPPPPPTVATSSPNSPSLGKHLRDENSGKEESSTEDSAEKCLWIPKTLRIDDPKEAVKSSLWATLGIENDKANPVRKPFKAFHPNIGARRLVAETSAFLQANPAALSRSLNFHDNAQENP